MNDHTISRRALLASIPIAATARRLTVPNGLDSLFPGTRFRSLKGSPSQDPLANDALCLLREDQVN